MKKLFIVIIFLQLTAFAFSQDCYSFMHKEGETAYYAGNYSTALKNFNAAKECPDKPATNDLDTWIAKCNTAIKKADDAAAAKKLEEAKKAKEAAAAKKLEETKKAEETAWTKAQNANTLESYKEYLKNYPAGKNKIACEALIKALDVPYVVVNLPETVKIKGGTFTMGSKDYPNATEHTVTLSDFEMSKYEVTNKQFAEFVNNYGSDKTKTTSDYPSQTMIYEDSDWGLVKSGTTWKPATGYEYFPVVYVTWYGAYEYCKWLSEKTGKKYSLPTEAQWEYAAGAPPSGGRGQKWAGTDSETSLRTYAWYYSNSDTKTHKVGTKTANSLGIYDMSGNVWEWCQDWYGDYSATAQTNPTGATSGSIRVLRGGGYYSDANYCYTAYRTNYIPFSDYSYYGFRVVFSL